MQHPPGEPPAPFGKPPLPRPQSRQRLGNAAQPRPTTVRRRLLMVSLWAVAAAAFYAAGRFGGSGRQRGSGGAPQAASEAAAVEAAMGKAGPLAEEARPRVLVSYAYFEKDAIQMANLDFFMKVGLGVGSQAAAPAGVDAVVVVNGDACTPCQAVLPQLAAAPAAQLPKHIVKAAWTSASITLLHRTAADGLDFGAHNATLEWLAARGRRRRYGAFLFLNSSARGPFFPTYMPRGWQWTDAFTHRLSDSVKAVASSLVCLPASDPGGWGPKIESWTYAVDAQGLDILTAAGVFEVRQCKLCDDGVVVNGEYALSRAVLDAGFNIATLMARYRPGIDWRDRDNWGCNDQVHPSRLGTYDGISQHPHEIMFVKASWHVGEPFTSRYSAWALDHAAGKIGTQGSFDRRLYQYAISSTLQPAAEVPKRVATCYSKGPALALEAGR